MRGRNSGTEKIGCKNRKDKETLVLRDGHRKHLTDKGKE